jgi:hypothetical protein
MISVLGKRKKMPTTLGINIRVGTIFISPEGSDEHTEWTADKLSHYSIEGKHVFLDLVRPSRSIDFHAGAKDTAHEIVSALGEIAGAYKAEGLREVIAASQGGHVQKRGQILYDFMAQGDDEVTVAVGDEVIVLDDSKSEEWWMVRRLKNGREGVVPSSYVEITGIVEPSSAVTGINAGRSNTEQNRLEEDRLAKEAARKSRTDSVDTPRSEVGPGMRLPDRRSSLLAVTNGKTRSQRHKHEKSDKNSSSKQSKRGNPIRPDVAELTVSPEPDSSKIRNWMDRTGTFTVEAQFIGLHEGKIHLHKINGIKIAVPVAKMSVEDLEYVEKVTGESLDEDKPLSDIRHRNLQQKEMQADSKVGGQVKQPEYDWFDFFLKAGVGPHQCERYAQNFAKDSMDEAILPDITPETLRTLGLKEGDILRVMRYLDNMLNRTGSKSRLRSVSFGGEEVIGNGEEGSGGLFSGPGGALRNNTRKGRPAPAVQTNDVVDPKAFESKDTSKSPVEKQETPLVSAPPPDKPAQRGFDDDAWDIKPPKQQPAASAPPAAPSTTATAPATTTEPTKPTALSGALADLSLLQAPLQPSPAQPSQPPQTAQPTAPIPVPPQQRQQTATGAEVQQPQATGANPTFFAQLGPLGQQQTGAPGPPRGQGFTLQPTGYQQQSQNLPPRQRPQPPQQLNQNSLLLPPPPQRPLSAPQDFQQSQFAPPPLQPQLTGLPHNLPQIAPRGQSLTELNQQRFQQSQYPQNLQPQATGFAPQFQNGLISQPTGYGPQPGSHFGFQQQQQQFGNPQIGAGPFADPRPVQQFPGLAPQSTGYGGFSASPQQPLQAGINGVPQPTGINGYGTSLSPPPVPPIPQQPTLAPLQPQKTGPAPPVRFGVKNDVKKLTPQPTGVRANLAQASMFHRLLVLHFAAADNLFLAPSNPFGF